MAEIADRIFENGTVHTMDDKRTVASAIALKGDRVLAVGDADAMLAVGNTKTERIELRGRTVIPGLIDSHNHMLSTGLNAEHVDLSLARTIAGVLSAIADRVALLPAGGWVITSSRWHESALAEQRFPSRDELDAVAPSMPVLVRRGGHNVVANSVALRMAGIDETIVDPPGGTYVRDANGRLKGHVIGGPAHGRLVRLLPETTPRQLTGAIERVCRLYNAAGITGVIEPGLQPAEIRAYQQARAAGVLTVRTVLMTRLNPGTTAELLEQALADLRGWPLLTGFGDDLLRIGGIKMVADGGVEANYVREPYAYTDDPSTPRGKPQISAENLAEVCTAAAQLGWQVGVHCVGDAAIDLVLEAFAAADRAHSIAALRWTLIHMTLAHQEQLAAATRLRLCIAAQQPLIYALGAGWVKYWGKQRASSASPLSAFVRCGLPVGGGSDSPVTPYQPLLGIWSSVTRATELAGALGPEWAIGATAALAWYTRGSAYLSFDEARRGSLEPGKLADLVVLSDDLLRVQPDKIKEIRVEQTILGGRTVYARDGSA